MTKFVYIATSLDGYIATAEGGIDWLNTFADPDETDYGYAEFMAGIDAVVMGRATFEQVLTFGEWPYDKPVFVLSRRLAEPPRLLQKQVEIVNAEPNELNLQLARRGLEHLYIDGGETITSFLRDDLIDEMIITKVPILLGHGIPLFGNFVDPLRFVHRKTEVYSNSLVKSHYIRER